MSEFDFDRLLDDVLEKDALAEPRPGIERRVLARVREERAEATIRSRGWWFGAAASLAACLVIAVAVRHQPGMSGISPAPPGRKPVAAPPSVIARSTYDVATMPETKRVPFHREGVKSSSRVRAVPAPAVNQVREQRLPKMDTFPAVAQRDVSPIARSPRTIEALQELKAEQAKPVEISAIVIQPL